MYKQLLLIVLAAGFTMMISAPGNVIAGPHIIGEPIIEQHMEIRAVYLQPGIWEPTVPRGERVSDTWLWWPTHGPRTRPDIHLEALVHAADDNPYGFSEGDFIPYLKIGFIITKKGSDWFKRGYLMAMATRNGPHYGDDIALDGPGVYRLKYRIYSPAANGLARHTDRETGVPPWWEPFDVEWEFTYVGVGKKGDY